MKLHSLPTVPQNELNDVLDGVGPETRERLSSHADLLAPLLAGSPYLRELARLHADWLADALAGDADDAMAGILAGIVAAMDAELGEAEVALRLRMGKACTALLCAVVETGGAWTTARATAALADLADAALDAALDVLVREAASKGALRAGTRAADCGLALFALGKHGGRELNYSSDIDIVAFFEPDAGVLDDPGEGTKIYSRIVQRLVGLMEDRREGGYVFRTDLRLRPDPGSTPVALGIPGALAYYESRGQNWERAAWIKARACAGDKRVGQGFIAELRPYVWRRHLDFATIADIQAMKRQINVARKVGDIRLGGHNVKLGRGGIREIEFFTQTQQLIAGGRDASLRVRPTAEALAALAVAGWIGADTARELTETYWFLRAVENRLQMRADEQTHTLPESAEELAVIARLMGYEALAPFEADYRAALERVARYYAELFAEQESLGTEQGSLVFTGSDDDPATLETLSGMGFSDPAKASATVRKWHYGSYAATRTPAARAHLTELLPALLKTFAQTGAADDAMARFDDFLSRLPAGVQLFSLLRSHPSLGTLLVKFMASAPRMAEAVIHRAHVMDGLIDPAFADDLTRREVLVGKVDEFLGEGRSYEEIIDRARIIGQEQRFMIAAGLLSGTISVELAAEQFTALAETLLRRLFGAVRSNFEQRHGRIDGARVGLLAFGKLASREMTATSDLDLVVIYDAPLDAESDGERPLTAGQYFTRLTQRLIAAVTAPTAEGVLYEADMRLRPSGNSGPLATSLSGFVSYHRDNAWTWEHLALSRARVILADDGLETDIETALAETFARSRDAEKTIADVVSMRELMARERPPKHDFDLKLVPGGLVDVEFIAQSAQLVAGRIVDRPQGAVPVVLRRMAETGLLPAGERLAAIHGVYTTVLQVMSAALTDPRNAQPFSEAFRELLAQLANYPDFDRLVADLADMRRTVSEAAAEWYEKARRLQA
jgi:glutamate-ammonia-ligase adenylyltransferase